MLKLDRWTLTASIALVIAALIACKKKEEEAPPAASATTAPTPEAPPSASAAPAANSDVKRYPDKEQEERGTVRVIFANAKVFKEADESTSHISTLSLGTLVNRKERMGNWMLVDWPSGPGELSPGWILTKNLDDKVLTLTIDQVKNQDAAVVVVNVPDASTATATTTPDAATTTATGTDGGKRLSIPIDQIKKAAEAAKKGTK